MSQGTTIEQQPQSRRQDRAAGPPGGQPLAARAAAARSLRQPAGVHPRPATRRRPSPSPAPRRPAFLIEARRGRASASGPIAHIRPDQSTAEIRAAAIQAFQDIVKPCVAAGQGRRDRSRAAATTPAKRSTASSRCSAAKAKSSRCRAVITRCRDLERARQRLQSMQLVAGLLRCYTLRRTSDQAAHGRAEPPARAPARDQRRHRQGFESAANEPVQRAGHRAPARRACRSAGSRARSIQASRRSSHTEQFDKKQELIVELEKVMEECHDQEAGRAVRPDRQEHAKTSPAPHQALSRSQGGHAVLSLPLRRKDEVVGVVTLEFLPNQQLGPQVASGLGVAVDLLAPQLCDRYKNDRWLITKAGISTRDTAKMVIGPKHMLAKLVIVLVIVAVLIVCNIPHQLYRSSWPGSAYLDARPMYRVSAPFEFVPTERRYVRRRSTASSRSAKIDGKFVKPGDDREEGRQSSLTCDATDLLMQLSEGRAQAMPASVKAQQYRNDRDRDQRRRRR